MAGYEKLIEKPCDLCGKPIFVRPRSLRRGWGRFHKRCAQITRVMGKKNPNFKRGKRAYHSERIKADRRAHVRARDGYKCVNCGHSSRELNPDNRVLDIHHVVPVGDGGDDTNDNLVSICRRCHNRVEHNRSPLNWWPRCGHPNPHSGWMLGMPLALLAESCV